MDSQKPERTAIHQICEVVESDAVDEVNQRLVAGWLLLGVTEDKTDEGRGYFIYSLGRPA